jgi:hypothetical protein
MLRCCTEGAFSDLELNAQKAGNGNDFDRLWPGADIIIVPMNVRCVGVERTCAHYPAEVGF